LLISTFATIISTSLQLFWHLLQASN